MVDERFQSKGPLKNGERKYLTTDHVRIRPGNADEVAIVRWIFARFLENHSDTAIAEDLNKRGLFYSRGVKWNRGHIGRSSALAREVKYHSSQVTPNAPCARRPKLETADATAVATPD
ncbi:recombinase family protein [Bradyrhizobium erythrophlei]|uniref:recombinase family protein n=1 Tax=Bradyrhizobium erythrophlei TaxID=1437360 RepID=UPI0035EA7E99